MSSSDARLDDAAAVLERTPGLLRGLLAGLSDRLLAADEGPETWSPFVIVGHLIQGERTDWIPRARIILEQGEIRPFDPFDRFAQLEADRGRRLDELLDEFERLRRDNLEILAGLRLTPGDLEKTGMHPELGRVTLGELVATWAVHDLGHVAQISRVMAKTWAGAVGPWSQYLPVLHDRRSGPVS